MQCDVTITALAVPYVCRSGRNVQKQDGAPAVAIERRGTSPAMSTRSSFPDYDSPPVHEVVMGLAFQPLVSLRIVHFGLIWEKIRSEFPNIEHAPLLGIEDMFASPSSGSGWPSMLLPRVWYINQSQDKLFQLQHDRFYVNWRSRTDGNPYPRYPAMIGIYEKQLAVIADVFRQEGVGDIVPVSYELKYVNHILKGVAWETFEDIGKIFPDLAWRSDSKRYLPIPVGGIWTAAFAIPNGMSRLNVRAHPGVRTVKDGKQEVLILELTVNGTVDSTKSVPAREWFDIAHEWIVKGFADLSSMDAQRRLWKRKDGND